ncbi:hypothetical protein HDU67_002333, partial [Dinochytrium kinnereticum]
MGDDAQLQTEASKLLSAARHSHAERPAILRHVRDLIHTRSKVVRSILGTVLSFAGDARQDVRLVIADLIETAVCRVAFPLEAKHYETVAVAVEALVNMFQDDDLVVLKKLMQCTTSSYPIAFVVLCTIQADAELWRKLELIKARIVSLITHENIGIRSHVLKFIQMLVLQSSFRDPVFGPMNLYRHETCLDICPRIHPFINIIVLESEGQELLALLFRIAQDKSTPAALVTAAINAMFPIVRVRSQFIQPIVQTLVSLSREPKDHLTSLEMKSVERTLKNDLLSILSLQAPEVTPLIAIISETTTTLGAKPHEISMRVKRDSSTLKRMAGSSAGPNESKRARTNEVAGGVDFDVQTIPLPIVTEIVVQTVASMTVERWNEFVLAYAAKATGQALPGAVPPRPAGRTSRDPRLRSTAPTTTETQTLLPTLGFAAPPPVPATTVPNILQQMLLTPELLAAVQQPKALSIPVA